MRGVKKLFYITIPLALVMSFVLSLAILSFNKNIFAGEVSASSGVYVGSGATYSVSGGTISKDIDVSKGTLTLTGGTINGNINLDGTMNLSSGCTINGTVNLLNTSSYITLKTSISKVIKVKPSSTANGTKIAYSSSASYLDISKFSVTGLGSNQSLKIVGNYIQIETKQSTFTVTINSTSGGSVDVTTIRNVPAGTKIITSGNTLTINGTTVRATASSGYKFSYWSYSGTTVESDMTITATFESTETTYNVTFSAGFGGSVDESELHRVPAGTQVEVRGNQIVINGTTITATAEPGFIFSHWTIEPSSTINSDTTITANFELNPDFTISASILENDGYSSRFEREYKNSSIAEKLANGGEIRILCPILTIEDLAYLRILFEVFVNGASLDEINIYEYFFIDDLKQAKEDLIALVETWSNATLVFEEYESDVYTSVLERRGAALSSYDLVWYYRDPTPLRSSERDYFYSSEYHYAYYMKNRLIYSFNRYWGAFDIYPYEQMLSLLINASNVDGLQVNDPSDRLTSVLEGLIDSLYTFIQNSSEGKFMLWEEWGNIGFDELLQMISDIHFSSNISYENFFYNLSPEERLLFFSLSDASVWQETYEQYMSYGDPVNAVYDLSYVIYRILTELYGEYDYDHGTWYDAYWNAFDKSDLRFFEGSAFYPGNLLLLDENVEFYYGDEVLEIMTEIADKFRNVGPEYWYWLEDMQDPSCKEIPYIYAGIDGNGAFGLLVAKGENYRAFDENIDHEKFYDGSYDPILFYDNKQYYLYPIKEKK